MAERRLNPDETEFMREYVQEGVKLGETEQQIKERRRELAALFGCSQNQVSGAVAWKKDQYGKLILEPLNLASEEEPDCTDTSKIFLAENETVTQESGLSTELAPFNGSAQEIYNNAEKQAWRRACKEFISANLTPKELKDAKVLCFCAADWFEVSEIYDPLNIRRENIWGVELDPTIQALAAAKAGELGTNFFAGRAEHFLEYANIDFDIVILDFKGQLSSSSLSLIENLRLSPNAILIVNHLRKREDKQMQKSIKLVAHGQKLKNSAFENPFDVHEILAKAEEAMEEDPMQLSECAEVAHAKLTLVRAGVGDKTKWKYKERLTEISEAVEVLIEGRGLNTSVYDRIMFAFQARGFLVIQEIRDLLRDKFLMFKDDEKYLVEIASCLNFNLESVTLFASNLRHSDSFRYINPQGHSPYVSSMGHLVRPVKSYEEMSDTAAFMLDAVLLNLKDEEYSIAVEDQCRNVITQPIRGYSNERLVLRSGQKVVNILNMRKLMKNYLLTCQLHDNNFLKRQSRL